MMRFRGLDLTKWPTEYCSAVLYPSPAHQSYIQSTVYLMPVRPTIQYLRSDCVVLSFVPIPELFLHQYQNCSFFGILLWSTLSQNAVNAVHLHKYMNSFLGLK